jgi:hypothetical protein
MFVITHLLAFLSGVVLILATLLSAISTFVVPRATRSRLNRLVFGLLKRIFEVLMRFTSTFGQRDAVMAYYAPIGLMLLLPVWYLLISAGYTLIYWSLGGLSWFEAFQLSGSSLLTLGFSTSQSFINIILIFSEAIVGLMMVGLLIAYLPAMYSAFSRREEAVNLLEVRAGIPPSAVQMILRYYRNHGLEKLSSYWVIWETWFTFLEESHSTFPALVFFRSPHPDSSWITAAGAVLDSAALTLSSVDIPYAAEAALSIRAGFLALRSIADYFEIPNPHDPHFPQDMISISRKEYDLALDELAFGGVPLKTDREKAWMDFAGWRVNYDQTLLALCTLTMAPKAIWSSDRVPPTLSSQPKLLTPE